jgi:hypothetical protein
MSRDVAGHEGQDEGVGAEQRGQEVVSKEERSGVA